MKRFLFLEIYRTDRRALAMQRLGVAFLALCCGLRYALALAFMAAAFVTFVPAALSFFLALILGATGFMLWPRKVRK